MAKTDYSDKTYRIGMIIGQVTGIIFLCGGILLMFLGITGTVNFVVSDGTLEAKLINASPGLVMALLGAIIIIFYKPKISSKEKYSETKTNKRENGFGAYTTKRITAEKKASSPIRR